ncbi:hypothetical protein [Polaribacter sp. IC073]|uniref:hypothetical protein n=1 Tax=Polaribacter sp. IC073 TaxID=2508540 RepID=UPI0011BE587B|nr:hypothetical protein [Polaribacter sp. IC073]TXD45894.1 hypothetical protein ES045_15835 [Polaribacter sp. IC073]
MTKEIEIILNDLSDSNDYNLKYIPEHNYKELASKLNVLFSLQGVGISFFTASDIGKEFEILANTSGHGFNIGEIVTLAEDNKDPDDDEYKFVGKDDYWFCNFADIKTK